MKSSKIKTFSQIQKLAQKHQKEGSKIIFIHGFFDIFHAGHAMLLTEAKKHGDILIVGIDHDDNAKLFKGPNRPINKYNARMFVVSCIAQVDYVFLVPSLKVVSNHVNFWNMLYMELKPNVVATCVQAGKFGEFKKSYAAKVNAKFIDVPSFYAHGTTKTIELLGL